MKYHKLRKHHSKMVELVKYRLYLQGIYEGGEIQLSFHGKVKKVDEALQKLVDEVKVR